MIMANNETPDLLPEPSTAPEQPTEALPGSYEKLCVLASRYRHGQTLFHAGDALSYENYQALPDDFQTAKIGSSALTRFQQSPGGRVVHADPESITESDE